MSRADPMTPSGSSTFASNTLDAEFRLPFLYFSLAGNNCSSHSPINTMPRAFPWGIILEAHMNPLRSRRWAWALLLVLGLCPTGVAMARCVCVSGGPNAMPAVDECLATAAGDCTAGTVEHDCALPNGSRGSCHTVVGVPTLQRWGFVTLAALLLSVAIVTMWRRQAALPRHTA